MEVTLFANFKEPVKNIELSDVLDYIGTSDEAKEKILHLRSLIREGKQEEYDKEKKKLLAFTVCGIYAGGRTLEHLVTYTKHLILDIDDIPELLLPVVIKSARQDVHTHACFISPSGAGLKVIVQVDTPPEHHKEAFRQVQKYYEDILHVPVDPSGKDITRLCFLSYDPSIYVNLTSQIFNINIAMQTANSKTEANKDLFEECVKYTSQKATYENGSRNHHIYLLASNCNRKGIPQADTLEMIMKEYNSMEPKEIIASVNSAYTHHAAEFATFASFARFQNNAGEHKEDFSQLLSSTPTIPDDVFGTLPLLLQSGCNAFENVRERDIWLTGSLIIVSGCISNVTGTYDNRTIHANLNCFITAPPASGKNALSSARDIAQAYHKKLIEESAEAMKQYKRDMQKYKNAMKKNEDVPEPPEEPCYRMLFIPANSSSAAVIKSLKYCDGKGIICETEADTLSTTFKQDWDGYSELLRKAFHHEPITYNRKGNNEHIEIDAPQLSVALAGTPSQVLSLISSSEDGLFSRFIFYAFRGEMKWRDVSPNGSRVNLTTHFNQVAEKVKAMIEYLDQSPTAFDLTADQWIELNTFFSNKLDHACTFISEDVSGTVMRLGLITFRIAMVITAIRKYEDGVADANIICDDKDFRTALKLADVYLQHGILMFKHLNGMGLKLEPQKQKLFDALPDEFTRQTAVAIGKGLSIAERTTDKYLKQLLGKFLVHGEYGKYQKL